MHVELAPRRREPVTISRRRGCARRCGGEVRPGHGGGVVDVQVLEEVCGAGGSGGGVRLGQVMNISCDSEGQWPLPARGAGSP